MEDDDEGIQDKKIDEWNRMAMTGRYSFHAAIVIALCDEVARLKNAGRKEEEASERERKQQRCDEWARLFGAGAT